MTLAGLFVASGVLVLLVATFYTARGAGPIVGVSRRLAELQHDEVSQVAWAGPVWLWQLLMDPQILLLATRSAFFAATVGLWVFPLLAWVVRRSRASDTSWAFLDPGGRLSLKPLGRLPVDPWRTGLIAGLGCLVAFLALRLALRNGVDADTRAQDLFLLAFFFWQLAIAVFAQVIAGAVAAARAGELPPLVASLAAAFVTGAIATAGIVVGPTVASCADFVALNPGPCGWSVDAGFTWDVLREVVCEGAVAALAGGAAVVAVRALLQRRQESEVRPAGVPG